MGAGTRPEGNRNVNLNNRRREWTIALRQPTIGTGRLNVIDVVTAVSDRGFEGHGDYLVSRGERGAVCDSTTTEASGRVDVHPAGFLRVDEHDIHRSRDAAR